MNSPIMQNHLSFSSCSNNHSNSNVLYDEVSEGKSISIATPKHRNDISTQSKSIFGTEQQHQHAAIPKSVDIDLKQQLTLKLAITNTATTTNVVSDTCKSLHQIVKIDTHNNDEHATKKEQHLQHRSCSARSNESTTTTTATTSTITTTTRTIKRVKFATDRKGRNICQLYSNKTPKTKNEMIACFYQMNDFQQFRRECKQEAILQQKTTTYRDNFAAVYAACTTGNFKNVTRERAYISAASCRGLEVVVFPTLHLDRKNLIATVLKTQSSLPKNMTLNDRMEAIASASRYLSKQARQLARVFGSGDAAVVIANQRIESLQQQHQHESPVTSNSDSDDSSDDSKHMQELHRKGRRPSKTNVADVPHCFVSC
jgi:hypothetical protein